MNVYMAKMDIMNGRGNGAQIVKVMIGVGAAVARMHQKETGQKILGGLARIVDIHIGIMNNQSNRR